MRAAVASGYVLAALAGCAASPGRLPPPAKPLVWPDAPEPTRIALASQFRGAADLGISKGFLARVADLVFGSVDETLRRPYAVAVWGDGQAPARIAVTDTEARLVRLFLLDRGEAVAIEEAGEEGRLDSPVGVAFDGDGRVYVVDSTKRLLVRYRPDGELDAVLAKSFQRPTGVAVDAVRGVVYVSDSIERAVHRFDFRGRALDPVDVPFSSPTHVAVDGAGRLLVSDALAFHVAVVSREGQLLATIGQAGEVSGTFSRPKGVGADSEGHVYVADALFDNVQIMDVEGRLLLAFGSAGDAPGELALPAGVAVDGRDLVYVCDCWNGRVQVFRYLRGEAGGR